MVGWQAKLEVKVSAVRSHLEGPAEARHVADAVAAATPLQLLTVAFAVHFAALTSFDSGV